MSNESGCIATNLKSCFKVNSVGQMLPGVHLKLQQVLDGEGTEVAFITDLHFKLINYAKSYRFILQIGLLVWAKYVHGLPK